MEEEEEDSKDEEEEQPTLERRKDSTLFSKFPKATDKNERNGAGEKEGEVRDKSGEDSDGIEVAVKEETKSEDHKVGDDLVESWNDDGKKTDSARSFFERGNTYFRVGKLKEAVQNFSKAIKLKKNFAEAYNNRGSTLGSLGNFIEAIRDYTMAIGLKRNDAAVYINRGTTYWKLGRFTDALQDYNKAIELRKDFATAFLLRGRTYNSLGKFKEAIQDYTKGIQLKKDDPRSYLHRGLTYRKFGKFTEAIQDYTMAIELKSDYADAYCNRGSAYSKIGEFTEAIQDDTMAIKLKKDDADAYFNRGYTNHSLGKLTAAIQDYTKAIELKIDYEDAYCNRAGAYDSLGKFSEAVEDFTKVIELKKDDADAYCNRAGAYDSLGKFSEAIQDFTKAILLGKDDADMYNNRGSSYYSLGKFAEAFQDYTSAIVLKKDDANAYYNRGNASMKLKNFIGAFQDYTKAIHLKKDSPMAYYSRGYIYDSLGKFFEAIQDYTKAIQLKGDFATAYYNRGYTYGSLGRFNESIQDYTRAIKLKQDDADAYYNRGNTYRNLGQFAKAFADFTIAMKDLNLRPKVNIVLEILRIDCEMESEEFVRKYFKVPLSKGIEFEGDVVKGNGRAFLVESNILGQKKRMEIYDGSFNDGRFHGKGVVFDKQKKVVEGMWRNGVLFSRLVKTKSFEVKEKNMWKFDLQRCQCVGSGAYCHVYKVKYRNVLCAYKLFNNNVQTMFYCEKFEKMLDVVYRLNHPNINIPFVHSLNFKGNTMGYISDLGLMSIERMIEKSRKRSVSIPLSVKLKVLHGVVEGMKYLHDPELNVLHRDLKWQNVMLFGDATIRIIDFGESKIMQSIINTRETGSLWFVAPEVLKRVAVSGKEKKAHYITKADVFSFGVMMYTLYFEVLTLRNGGGVFELMDLFYENLDDFKLNLKIRPKIDPKKIQKGEEWIVELMRHCWDHDPKKRPSFADLSNIFLSKISKKGAKLQEFLERIHDP